MSEAFKSPTKEEFGLSCAEALKQHLIEKSYRLVYGGKMVADGWEACNSCAVHHKTQEAALRHYFAVKVEKEAALRARITAGPKANEVFRFREGDNFRLVFGDGRVVTLGTREMRQHIFELTDAFELVDV